MALDPAYTRYEKRRYGMDHDLYDWSMLPRRKPVSWPDGARIALWVVPALEFFPLNGQGKPFKLPGGMVTPYPDLRHFTLRDYGNRVGVWRFLKLFDRLGLRGSVAVNQAVAERYPALVRSFAERGWEALAHGRDMDTPHYGGMPEDDERRIIADSLATLRDVSGQPVRGWLSPGKSQSMNTYRLLAEAGLAYVCDWINDDMPYPVRTPAGPITAMPHSSEISDRQILVDFRHTEAEFARQILDQYDFLDREARTQGGRILAITLHPWVSGQPHRIGALEEALTHVAQQRGVWAATGSEILDCWQAQQ